jgi:hypothetical protein
MTASSGGTIRYAASRDLDRAEEYMSWFQTGLFTLALVARTGSPVPAVKPVGLAVKPDGVVVACDDFARIADGVFTGRPGATFTVKGVQDDLSGDTFGPNALLIGGVDPALYLQHKCWK